MILSIIVAYAQDKEGQRIIGKDNSTIVENPEEMSYYLHSGGLGI